MKPSNAPYQAAYRARQNEKFERRGKALDDIMAFLADSKGAKALKIMAIAKEGMR